MTETTRCPYCGCPRESPLDSLYREVARIREIAERSAAGDEGARIAELTREVDELRATVARLRGSAVPGLARSG